MKLSTWLWFWWQGVEYAPVAGGSRGLGEGLEEVRAMKSLGDFLGHLGNTGAGTEVVETLYIRPNRVSAVLGP